MLGLKATHSHFHMPHMPNLTEVRRIYWAHSLKLVAANLVTIFIPIYLLKLGYDLSEIILYYLLMAAFWLVLQYPLTWAANRIGAHRAMAIALAVQFCLLLLLSTLPSMQWPLWLLSLAWAVEVALYYPCYRASFAKGLGGKHPGRSVGVSTALTTIAYGTAPAVGGVIATVFGINAIYIAAMVILVVAAFPLLFGPEIIRNDPFKLSALKLRRVWRDFAASSRGTSGP